MGRSPVEEPGATATDSAQYRGAGFPHRAPVLLKGERPMTQDTTFTLAVNYWPRKKAMYWWKDFDRAEGEAEFGEIAALELGLLMLIGIVVTNAIVLLDLVQHKSEAGDDLRTALMQGGRTRVRPILMTAAATILALIPLVFSTGGGLIAASLAIVVLGGRLSSTLLTLVVIPVIYSLLAGLRGSGAGSSGQKAWTPATDQA